jgi:membrane-anchored mycosin MYCP
VSEKKFDAAHLPCVPDDLVVGLPSLQLVTAELETFGIDPGPARTSADLGLALVSLKGGEDVVPRVRSAALAVEGDRPAPDDDEPLLDQVLWALRRIFASRYAGWTPLLGKNRLVGRVHGVGEVSHGGCSDPTPADPVLSPPQRGTGPGTGVRVGVLDTGLYAQPWLAGGWAARYGDLVRETPTHLYPEGHATFIAGLVLNQAPGATVEVRQVLGADGTADSWTVAQEIVRFGNSGLDVLNLSFVCYTEDGEAPLLLAAAVDRLDPHLVVVAAAGNHGAVDVGDADQNAKERIRPAWPAALDDVVAAGAAKPDGSRAGFSPDAPWVDVITRGTQLRSTYLHSASGSPGATAVKFEGWASWEGTSFAAALVSGAVAAGTQPGRTSGREALRSILDAVSGRGGAASTGPSHHAKYLELSTW